MKIGILGSGAMADALASKWAEQHELVVGGRNSEKVAELVGRLGRGVQGGDLRAAAAFGDVIVVAVPHAAVADALESVGADVLVGKVLIDISNPVDLETFLPSPEFQPSMAEFIAQRAPRSHVVKAFNMCQASVWKLADPSFDGRRLVAMFCGDDQGAKNTVAGLIRDVGCEPLDLGPLYKARLLEPAANIVIQLLFSGRDPLTVLNLIQPETRPVVE